MIVNFVMIRISQSNRIFGAARARAGQQRVARRGERTPRVYT